MNWNKYLKIIFIICILAMLNGCGDFPDTEQPQSPSEAGASQADADIRMDATDADNKHITIDEVKSIVLKNAGFTEENVRFVRLKLVPENGSGKYDVEFVSDTMEYDYRVDAVTGEILSMSCEMRNYDIASIPSDIGQTDIPSSGKSTDQHEGNEQHNSNYHENAPSDVDSQYIGREAAQQAALLHAGLDAGTVRFAHTHLEFDDGRWQYDVEFHKGNEEYDYDIDALTGEVISFDYDGEYINSGGAAAQNGEYITQEQAKQLALAHAEVSESDTQHLKIELDFDDGHAEYEVEWNVGRIEFSCDVDAYTGQILSFEKELD